MREPRIAVKLANLKQGPPSISWPYMMSDKTWKVYKELQASSNEQQDACLKEKLRRCEMRPMRMCRDAAAPVYDGTDECKENGVASI